MDPKLIKQIVLDSAELLEKTAALSDQAAEVPGLKQKVAELSNQNAAMAKTAADSLNALTDRVQKYAEHLVEVGSLEKGKVASFVEIVRNDPSQIVDVMEKLANQASSASIEYGSPAGDPISKEASEKADPIVQFAMS